MEEIESLKKFDLLTSAELELIHKKKIQYQEKEKNSFCGSQNI